MVCDTQMCYNDSVKNHPWETKGDFFYLFKSYY